MTQLSPTTLLYAQAIAKLQDFRDQYADGDLTAANISENIAIVLSDFANAAGMPLVEFIPYQPGEPPLSDKVGRFLNAFQTDINIMEDQVDLLRASAVFVHNFMATEIARAQNENAQASNKLKTLQLYSNANDSNVINFGDYFLNEDFIDIGATSINQRPSLVSPGNLTLTRETSTINLSKNATVKILPSSNGFKGNNQETTDPTAATTDPTTNEKRVTFKAETTRHAEVKDLLDGFPNTWFEYENYFVFPADKIAARNFNFSYRTTNSASTASEQADLVYWADGPSLGVLKLDLEFDLKAVKTINNFTYSPFGLDDNKNNPVRVTEVKTSEAGTDWLLANPQNVWIGTDANLQTSRAADNVVIGSATWAFDQRDVRFVRISVEQPNAIDCNVGHLYYETRPQEAAPATPPSEPSDVPADLIPGERAEGPIPTVDHPDQYYNISSSVQGNLLQKREFFNGKRWAIGVRDCLIEEVKYKATSALVSKPFRINGIVDRVALEADTFVPGTFDTTKLWIKFYVSPDEGLNWYPISRIQDDFNGIPEIIAFNDPLPAEFREPGVTYFTTNGVVNSLRVKIELSRPTTAASSSPIVRSYKLKVRRR